MRLFRLLLLAVGGVVLLAGLGLAVAFNSSFQTWAARRVLAAQPDLGVSIGRIAAGLGQVRVQDLRFEREGVVVIVPALEVDLPLYQAARNRSVKISRLVARGWLADLSKRSTAAVGGASTRAATSPAVASGPKGAAGPAATRAFPAEAQAAGRSLAGVLSQLELPCDLVLDGVDLAGEVVLPESRGRVKLTVAGGGFAAGREGRLAFAADAALADPRVNRLGLKGNLTGRMDGPRLVAQVALQFDAVASGSQFPNGVELAGSAATSRVPAGESYGLTLATQGWEILNLKAEYVRDSSRLAGTWKINMREADVAPFALGVRLPVFTAAGEGAVDADAGLAAIRVHGKLVAEGERLDALQAELAVLGKITLDADFDLAERSGVIAVQRLHATIAAAEPLATVRTLQPFEFTPATGALQAADATRDLVGISLHAIPVSWAAPFVGSALVSGTTVRGELVGLPRGGGVAMRSSGPITIGQLSLAIGSTPAVTAVDLAFGTTLDYNPKGWQGVIEGLTVKSGGATLLTLDARAGRLAGENQPLRSTGKISAHLPALLAQPVAKGKLALTAGDAALEFAASLGAVQELHAKVDLQGLEAVADHKVVRLPILSADVRADIAANGRMAFSAPILIQAETRKSDLAVTGSLVPVQGKIGTVEAIVTSHQLVVDDVRAFFALVPGASPDGAKRAEPVAPAKQTVPPWSGLDGSLTLQLKEVTYSDTFRASNVAGRFQIDAGKVRLEGMQVGLGENGRANLEGVLTFDAALPQPFGLEADVAVREFDPGPLLQAMERGRPATVEGKFDIVSRLASRAGALEELAASAGGEFQLTSKGGVFRGLPATVANAAGTTGRVAGFIAAAGSALGGLTGKKEYTAISNKAQAVAEFASGLNAIAFDQLSVAVSRDVARNATLKDFTLIAPEIRLAGGGTILHRPGASLLEDSLAMEFKLRARGRQGELLKYLGALDSAPDDLGYVGCTLPIRIGGSLGQPETGDLNARLAALALEKSGVTDKASELFNKLIGGAK